MIRDSRSMLALHPDRFEEWFTKTIRSRIDRQMARWSDMERDLVLTLLEKEYPLDDVACIIGRSSTAIKGQLSSNFKECPLEVDTFDTFWVDMLITRAESSTLTCGGEPFELLYIAPLFTHHFTVVFGYATDAAWEYCSLDDKPEEIEDYMKHFARKYWPQGRRFTAQRFDLEEIPFTEKQLETLQNKGAAVGLPVLELGLLLSLEDTSSDVPPVSRILDSLLVEEVIALRNALGDVMEIGRIHNIGRIEPLDKQEDELVPIPRRPHVIQVLPEPNRPRGLGEAGPDNHGAWENGPRHSDCP